MIGIALEMEDSEMHVDQLITSPNNDVIGMAIVRDLRTSGVTAGRIWLRTNGTWSERTRETSTSYPDDVLIFKSHAAVTAYLDEHFPVKNWEMVEIVHERDHKYFRG